MIFEAIKSICPGILDSQFRLQDDGTGPYIAFWSYGQPQPTQAQIDAAIPGLLKAAALYRINADYQTTISSMTSGYPADEVQSWSKQETEARAWLADNTAATPWIDAAASSRGITKAALVNLIIANANALAPFHGAITGKRQRLRDQIEALGATPTQAQLDAIQW